MTLLTIRHDHHHTSDPDMLRRLEEIETQYKAVTARLMNQSKTLALILEEVMDMKREMQEEIAKIEAREDLVSAG